MSMIIPIRRGDFVCYEETIENWWGNPIGVKKQAGTVVSNPRDPYTGRFCKADEWCAVVRLQPKQGEAYDVKACYLTHIKRLEDFTCEDLAQLRSEVTLNSLYESDYQNSFGISQHSASLFFDSYLDDICDRAREDGYLWDYAEPGSAYYKEGYHTWPEFLEKYDTTDNLYAWWCCYDDFDWVTYEGEEELRKAA